MENMFLVSDEPHLRSGWVQEQSVFYRAFQFGEVLIRPIVQIKKVHVLGILYYQRALELNAARRDELWERLRQFYLFHLVHGFVVNFQQLCFKNFDVCRLLYSDGIALVLYSHIYLAVDLLRLEVYFQEFGPLANHYFVSRNDATPGRSSELCLEAGG